MLLLHSIKLLLAIYLRELGGIQKFVNFIIIMYHKETCYSLQLVTRFKPKDYHTSSALLTINKDKNRSTDLLPIELSRVRLPNKPGVEGSDYINASFLHVSFE